MKEYRYIDKIIEQQCPLTVLTKRLLAALRLTVLSTPCLQQQLATRMLTGSPCDKLLRRLLPSVDIFLLDY